MVATRFVGVQCDHSLVQETCCTHDTHNWCSRTLSRHVSTTGSSTIHILCKSQAQRLLLSHDSLSWVTSAGIKELLCVSWTFRLWGTFLLSLEPKSIWGPTKFPVSAAAWLCFQRPEGLVGCQELGKGSTMQRVGHEVVWDMYYTPRAAGESESSQERSFSA